MALEPRSRAQDCNCCAVQQAVRHVTQFYDRFRAPGRAAHDRRNPLHRIIRQILNALRYSGRRKFQPAALLRSELYRIDGLRGFEGDCHVTST